MCVLFATTRYNTSYRFSPASRLTVQPYWTSWTTSLTLFKFTSWNKASGSLILTTVIQLWIVFFTSIGSCEKFGNPGLLNKCIFGLAITQFYGFQKYQWLLLLHARTKSLYLCKYVLICIFPCNWIVPVCMKIILDDIECLYFWHFITPPILRP